jgi:hypothetical protein
MVFCLSNFCFFVDEADFLYSKINQPPTKNNTNAAVFRIAWQVGTNTRTLSMLIQHGKSQLNPRQKFIVFIFLCWFFLLICRLIFIHGLTWRSRTESQLKSRTENIFLTQKTLKRCGICFFGVFTVFFSRKVLRVIVRYGFRGFQLFEGYLIEH